MNAQSRYSSFANSREAFHISALGWKMGLEVRDEDSSDNMKTSSKAWGVIKQVEKKHKINEHNT